MSNMEILNMYVMYCKISIKSWFQYRLDAFLRSFAVMFRESTSIIVIYIAFKSFKNIGMWNIYELLFLYSFLFLTYGIFIIFFTGLRDFQGMVEKGELDRLFLRPRGILFQVMASNSDWFAAIGHGFLGILLFLYSAEKCQIQWSLVHAIIAVLCIISGVMIQGAIFLVFASISIFVVKTEAIKDVLYWNIKKFMGYPISIYHKVIQVIVVYIIPLAFINYFPSQLLMKKVDVGNCFPYSYCYISAILGFFLYLIAYGIWRISLKYYTSTGS